MAISFNIEYNDDFHSELVIKDEEIDEEFSNTDETNFTANELFENNELIKTEEQHELDSDFSEEYSEDVVIEENLNGQNPNFTKTSTTTNHNFSFDVSVKPPPSSNESHLSENDNNEIVITASKRTPTGKRIRNKVHACYFCQKIVRSSAKHFEAVHATETEVAKILAMPKNSKERREAFGHLIRTGDFYHNTSVLENKQGELILARCPTENELQLCSYSDFVPCTYCLGFMLKKNLWYHIKYTCTAAKGMSVENVKKNSIAESNELLNSTFGNALPKEFKEHILSKFRDDRIGLVCKEDDLIVQFGELQFEKYGASKCDTVRQSMRQLARFTLKLRELDGFNKSLSDFLLPKYFNLVKEAVESLCGKKPSLEIKIVYGIKKCLAIKRGLCIRSGDIEGNKMALFFISLIKSEWNVHDNKGEAITFNGTTLNLEDIPIHKESNIKGGEDLASGAANKRTFSPEPEPEEVLIKPEALTAPQKHRAINKGKRKCLKRPWSLEEKAAVLNFFANDIKRASVPGKQNCLECINDNYSILKSRLWTDVKFCVKNHMDKIKKMK